MKIKSPYYAIPISAIAMMLCSSVMQAAVIAEIEANNSPFAAQLISTTAFTNEYVPEIEGSAPSGYGTFHATITGLGDGSVDWYFFQHIGDRLVVDIDGVSTPDLSIGLFNIFGTLIATSDNSMSLDPGSFSVNDPMIDIENALAGNYLIAVLSGGASFANGYSATGSGVANGTAYTMHISIPEPSTAFLGCIGVLALLRRRRA